MGKKDGEKGRNQGNRSNIMKNEGGWKQEEIARTNGNEVKGGGREGAVDGENGGRERNREK